MFRFLVGFLFIVFSSALTAQEIVREEFYENGGCKLRFEQINKNLVKATYFHDNGVIAETGFYLDEELYGFWESYDQEANKLSSGYFESNRRKGSWNHWSRNELVGVVSYPEKELVWSTR